MEKKEKKELKNEKFYSTSFRNLMLKCPDDDVVVVVVGAIVPVAAAVVVVDFVSGLVGVECGLQMRPIVVAMFAYKPEGLFPFGCRKINQEN